MNNENAYAVSMYEHERTIAMLQSVIEDQRMQIEQLRGSLKGSVVHIGNLEAYVSRLEEDLAMAKAEGEEW